MRVFALVFGVLCGGVVIAIAARYGFKTSDNDFDGYIWAFTYAAVTTGGLFGHALALRVWRHDRRIGLAAGVISAFALVISLSNSLGAMAGRGNEQQAERMRVADTVRDLRRGLERAETERKDLKFEAADEAAVNAAKVKATAATAAKDAACKYRGQRCRDKEAAETADLAALEAATRNKATTDRAAKLDSDISAFREKIERAGPVLEANSQGNALARLFNLPEAKASTLSTYQNLAMALVIELLIVMSMVVGEALEHHEVRAAAPLARPAEAAPVMQALPMEDEPKAFPAPKRPRLIASQATPVGSVPVILADILEPGRGRVEIADLFAAYAEACEAQGKRPVPANEFPAELAKLCEQLGIKIEGSSSGVFLLKVKIGPARNLKAEGDKS